MEIIGQPEAYQRRALEWRRTGLTHAQVPTMGALHEGHFQLIHEARRRADRVSVTLFVNPIQFNQASDLEKYPRTWEADVAACRELGVDVLFAPTAEAMYPDGFQTHVEVERLSAPLCGRTRPGHFRGVTTVVAKLMLLGQPTYGIFGWKDAQQFIVLQRMVKDLAIPIEMIGVDTVREADGLAKSSRNKRLTPEARAAAPAIYRGLCAAQRLFALGETDAQRLLNAARAQIESAEGLTIEYLEARSLTTLEEIETARGGDTILAVAVWAGDVRLIDNIRL